MAERACLLSARGSLNWELNFSSEDRIENEDTGIYILEKLSKIIYLRAVFNEPVAERSLYVPINKNAGLEPLVISNKERQFPDYNRLEINGAKPVSCVYVAKKEKEKREKKRIWKKRKERKEKEEASHLPLDDRYGRGRDTPLNYGKRKE